MDEVLSPFHRKVRIFISLFIVWNICAILLTNTSAGIGWDVQKIFLPYAKLTRIMQRWSLFAPEPRRYFHEFHFEITFKDGSRQSWQRPYPPNWGYFARQSAYNWQKFDLAGQNLENRVLRPDIGEWVNRKFMSESNPPTRIELYSDLANVPPPQDGALILDPSQAGYFHQLVFAYPVQIP